MPINPITTKSWNRNLLQTVLLELTYRCNLACVYCYNDKKRKEKPMRRGDYTHLLEDLAAMGVFRLTISGGEPLASPHFFFVGRVARRLDFAVRIKTNGHALDGETAARIKTEIDPFQIEFSLHGARPQSHDRQTRVRGSFAKLMSHLETARECGLRVRLNCTLTRWNEEEIEPMLDLAHGLGLELNISPWVSPRDDGDRGPLELEPTAVGLARLLRVLKARSTAPSEKRRPSDDSIFPNNCGAGSTVIAVDPFGHILPCVQWRRSLGNLHEASIREIWSHSPALTEIRQINRAAKKKLQCLDERDGCPRHCMGLSEITTGDPLALDPQALAIARIRHRIEHEPQIEPLPV